MIETGDYVDIRYQNEARHKKPVGIYWLQAGVVRAAEAIGVPQARTTIWLYRVPSLIGAIGAVLLTYWTALAFVSRRTAYIAGLMMATSVLLTMEARFAKTDAMLLFCCVAAMGVMARAYLAQADRDIPWGHALILWTAIAAGILLKGPLILMVVGLAAIALAIADRSGRWLMRLRRRRSRPGQRWNDLRSPGAVPRPFATAGAVPHRGARTLRKPERPPSLRPDPQAGHRALPAHPARRARGHAKNGRPRGRMTWKFRTTEIARRAGATILFASRNGLDRRERAVRARLHGGGEPASELGVALADALDGVLEPPLHVDARSLHVRSGPTVAPAQAHGAGQLRREGVDLFARSVGALEVTESLGLRDFILEALEALLVFRLGACVEHGPGVSRSVLDADQESTCSSLPG